MIINQQQERQLYKELSRKQAKTELFWESELSKLFQRQTVPVISALVNSGYSAALGVIASSFAPDQLAPTIQRLYRQVGVASANDTYGYIQRFWGDEIRAEKRFGFNQVWANIMSGIFRAVGALNVVRITDSNREWIRRQLIQGQQDGIDNFTLAERLRGPQIWRSRAKLIARTETGIAASTGADTGARQTGILMNKKWLSAQDKRVRRIPPDQADHQTMNNTQVSLSDVFVVPIEGGVTLMQHPHSAGAPAAQVCNCRCKVIYIPARDARGRVIRV